MPGFYKTTFDSLPIVAPDPSEIEMDNGAQANPERGVSEEDWYEYAQSRHRTAHRTVSEPSVVGGASTAGSTWSTGSFRSVSELTAVTAGPSASASGPRARKTRLFLRRRGHEGRRTTGKIVTAIKNDETLGPQKDEVMRDVQRVGTEPLSLRPGRDGMKLPSELEMRDDPDDREAAPFPEDVLQPAMAPLQNPLPESDNFDLSTMRDALPRRASNPSSYHIYDFTKMNDALPGTPFFSSYVSRTRAKVRQIREDRRH